MFSIWVFVWPVYHSVVWLWIGLLIVGSVILAAALVDSPFWRQLNVAWSTVTSGGKTHLHAPMSLWFALFIAVILFEQGMGEFGLGLGLAATLAFPLARLIDRTRFLRLGLHQHPNHTLPGHLALVVSLALFCAWSIHTYHGVDWYLLMPTVFMAGFTASLIRIMLPQWWSMPVAVACIATMLWYV